MRYEPKDEDRRREQAFRRLGTRNPKCSVEGCTESDWQVFTGNYPNILCYAHAALSRGRSPIEGQHPSGRANSGEVIRMSGNDHRFVDEPKRDWPEMTRRNPNGSPLLTAAASVRTAMDWLRLIIERYLGPVANFLELLDERLTEVFGAKWWEALGLSACL